MIYVWRCTACGKQHETERPMKDSHVPPDQPCECGEDKFEKLVSKSNFILLGSGWYRDGYGR